MEVLGRPGWSCNDEQPPAYFVELPGGVWAGYPGDRRVQDVADNKLEGWRHLALRVASIEQARAELERRGVAFTEPVKPAGGGGRVLFFRMPRATCCIWWSGPPTQSCAAAEENFSHRSTKAGAKSSGRSLTHSVTRAAVNHSPRSISSGCSVKGPSLSPW